MPEIKLLFAYSPREPNKQYAVCDLDEGGIFADPLDLIYHPSYDPYNVNIEGLYAVGGQLDIKTLLMSYKWGIFPWFPYKQQEEAYWYCPKDRFVIFPETIHIGHSLRNLLNKGKYFITVNKTFREVIHNCRIVNGRDLNNFSWLGDKIEELFIQLHDLGYAKSIEVWEKDELIGGFYGFWYKGIFQGESMFSLRPSASQIGLVELCRKPFIDGERIKLVDTQFETPTFKRLGGEYISYKYYRQIMDS